MDRYTIARNICRLCEEQQICVEQLAEMIGKSTRQMNRYRNGQCKTIPLDVLNTLADALHTTIPELLM